MAKKKIEMPALLVNAVPSYEWQERADYKKENRTALRKSMEVALRILDILDERNMSQQDLADKLSVTRQQVSKILKGQENMTFETVEKLEKSLGIELIRILNNDNKEKEATPRIVHYRKLSYRTKATELTNQNQANKKGATLPTEYTIKGRYTYPEPSKVFMVCENNDVMDNYA